MEIDGLIHLSDLSWTEKEEEAQKIIKKGKGRSSYFAWTPTKKNILELTIN